MSKEALEETINVLIKTSLSDESEFVDNKRILKKVLILLKAEDQQSQEQGLKQLKAIIDQTIDQNFLQQYIEIIVPLIININLGKYAINVLAGISKILPEIISQPLDYLKAILDEKETAYYLNHTVTTAISKIIKAMPGSEALKTAENILANNSADSDVSYAATKAIPKIIKVMTMIEALKAIEAISNNEKTNKHFMEEVNYAVSKKVNAMPTNVALEFFKDILANKDATSFLKEIATRTISKIVEEITEGNVSETVEPMGVESCSDDFSD